jgi:hypothetical protein
MASRLQTGVASSSGARVGPGVCAQAVASTAAVTAVRVIFVVMGPSEDVLVAVA